MQKITTFLWFDKQAEEAAKFYCSVFKKSKILGITRHLEGAGTGVPGDVLTVQFRLGDQEFTALNGGPMFKFTEAISLMIACKDQKEVDYYWEKLGEGGDENAQACGWLKDRYGVSWQVVPTALTAMLADPDTRKTESVMKSLLQMKKLDLGQLQEAYGAR